MAGGREKGDWVSGTRRGLNRKVSIRRRRGDICLEKGEQEGDNLVVADVGFGGCKKIGL